MAKNTEFKYEITKHIATLSESNGYTVEVNMISYNDKEPKLDIRKWDRNKDVMLKGISLSADEVKALTEALKEICE